MRHARVEREAKDGMDGWDGVESADVDFCFVYVGVMKVYVHVGDVWIPCL